MISSIGSQGTMSMMSARPPAPPPDPEEKFQELDSDGDGALSLEELQTMAEEISGMTGQTVTAEDLLEKMEKNFRLIHHLDPGLLWFSLLYAGISLVALVALCRRHQVRAPALRLR